MGRIHSITIKDNMVEEFLKMISALNDPSRVLILAFLKKHGELCVCDLQESLDMIQSRLSRHLKILKEAGFLMVHRRGIFAYYAIKHDLSPYHMQSLEAITHLELHLPQLLKTSCADKAHQASHKKPSTNNNLK